MAESTLSLQYKDLERAIGIFLGYGRGAAFGDTAFTTLQQDVIDQCLASGLRQFYWPKAPDGTGATYEWSFLKPVGVLPIPINVQTVPLYDDFGGMEGQGYLSAGKSTQWWPLDFVGIGEVLMRYSELPTTTGRPILIAVEPLKGTTAQQGTRYQLHIWPITDQPYSLKFQYYVNPDYINTAFPYHMGGAIHAETVRAACLKAAEATLDDQRGLWAVEFEERLLASINADRKLKPQTLGYNGDQSDKRYRWNRGDQHGWTEVTVRGVQY